MGDLLLLNTVGSSLPCLGNHISEEEYYPDWRVCWRIPARNGVLETVLDSPFMPSLPSPPLLLFSLTYKVKGCC